MRGGFFVKIEQVLYLEDIAKTHFFLTFQFGKMCGRKTSGDMKRIVKDPVIQHHFTLHDRILSLPIYIADF